ncbi:MAG: MBL fold metallo-hydrolase [Proteobacteria bacterium]|nr:MBL fold metallo-hydrolase [Pseudomonadota bacterium]
MNLIKYPQSCFMLKTENKNILVDPGNLLYDDSFLDEWKKADYILITHRHGDHCYEDIIKKFDCPIYSTQQVQDVFSALNINIVKEGDVLNLDGIKVEVVKAEHGYIPWLKNGAEITENVGYIIEVESKRIYFTSDTICFDNDYKCDVLCAPVCGHGLVMSAFEAALFAKECEANLVIPHHMDNPKFQIKTEEVENTFKQHEVNYKILSIGGVLDI